VRVRVADAGGALLGLHGGLPGDGPAQTLVKVTGQTRCWSNRGQMRGALFSGFAGDYRGTGPHKMKHYTGNVVDLDTV
jgi:hypothetical protein